MSQKSAAPAAKLPAEKILRDIHRATSKWQTIQQRRLIHQQHAA